MALDTINSSRRFPQITAQIFAEKKIDKKQSAQICVKNQRKSARNSSFLTVSFLLFIFCNTATAQHVSFGTWAGGDIVLTTGVPGDLDFNDKTPVINPGVNQSVTINLQDAETAVLSIEGTEYYDVTVYVDAPPTLMLDPSNSIPVNIRFAYSNLNPTNVTVAKNQAIEVPAGFNTATFPILRRTSGPPGPPPTPPSAGYTPPRKTAYLFIYGTLGPVGSVDAGRYDGTINITVEYTKFN
jgi:hypothetical protein